MRIFCTIFLCSLTPLTYAASPTAIDACKLLSAAEVAQAQSAKIASAKGSARDNGDLTSSLCFYTAVPFSQSVSLQIVSHSPADRISVRDYWKEKFESSQKEKKDEEVRESGEKEPDIPPRKVAGVGDEAYWVNTGRDGALYALKNDYLLRCSVGGKADQDAKMKKCARLTQSAIQKLPSK